MSFEALNALSPASLRTLANSLQDGALSKGLDFQPLHQIAGAQAAEVSAILAKLREQGMTPWQMGRLVSAIAETRECIPDPSLVLELVLSGPPVASIPTRHTAAVVRTLFAEAQREVLVAGYAIYKGSEIFAPLHARLRAIPGLAVRLCLDIPRRDQNPDEQKHIERFTHEFTTGHWPWPERPALYFYPRSLEREPAARGSLHTKCVIVDRRVALITSANFTEAAQNRNLEAGLLIRFAPIATRLCRYFEGLMEAGHLHPVKLPEAGSEGSAHKKTPGETSNYGIC